MLAAVPAPPRQKLRISSWNAQSCIGDKANNLFASMYDPANDLDILCVQETHWTPPLAAFHSSQHPNNLKSHYALGTSSSRGVLTCIRSASVQDITTVPITITAADRADYPSLQEGRVVVSQFKFCGSLYTVANIYAPNHRAQRNDFFRWLAPKLTPLAGNLVVAGDWNCVESPVDRSTNRLSHDDDVVGLSRFMENLNQVDVYRLRNPDGADFTFHRANHFSRIDRITVDTRLLALVDAHKYTTIMRSDHPMSPVVTIVPEEAIPRGRGYWRMNASLLKNDKVKADLRNCVLEAFPVFMCTADPIASWLKLKATLKGRLRHFAALRTKEQARAAKDLKEGVLYANRLLRRMHNAPLPVPAAIQEAEWLVLMRTTALADLCVI